MSRLFISLGAIIVLAACGTDAAKMATENPFPEEQLFLELLLGESRIKTVGFHDLHVMAHKEKRDAEPMEVALLRLKGVRTHFSLTGIKTEKR